jgi:hypothetical protein
MLNGKSERPHGLDIARVICEASDAEVSKIFRQLRTTKQLSATVHELNEMLASVHHRTGALLALRRLGLEYAG